MDCQDQHLSQLEVTNSFLRKLLASDMGRSSTVHYFANDVIKQYVERQKTILVPGKYELAWLVSQHFAYG